MALTCPHCASQIRGHLRQCQVCGTWNFSDAEVCQNCGNSMYNIENKAEKHLSHTETAHEKPHKTVHGFTSPCPIEPTKNRGRKQGSKWTKVIGNLCIVVICTGAVAYGVYKYDSDIKTQKEFINQELAKRIAEDEKANAQKLQQAQQDSIYWSQTLKTKTIEAARQYIAEYPEGIFINEAYMLIEELQRRAVTPTERKHIMDIVENSFARVREQFIKNGTSKAQDLQLCISDTLSISKKHISRDSIMYVVSGKVNKIIITKGKNKPDTSVIDLHMTLDKHRNIMENSLASQAGRQSRPITATKKR